MNRDLLLPPSPYPELSTIVDLIRSFADEWDEASNSLKDAASGVFNAKSQLQNSESPHWGVLSDSAALRDAFKKRAFDELVECREQHTKAADRLSSLLQKLMNGINSRITTTKEKMTASSSSPPSESTLHLVHSIDSKCSEIQKMFEKDNDMKSLISTQLETTSDSNVQAVYLSALTLQPFVEQKRFRRTLKSISDEVKILNSAG